MTLPRSDGRPDDLPTSFRTPRLVVRPATESDVAFIAALWSDPRVMRHVGFPCGMPTARVDVPARLQCGAGLSALLIAELSHGSVPIGQGLIGEPNAQGVTEPDIKLDPTWWGLGYGRELWAGLVDQAFVRSSCAIVRGTPNVANAASIRMQSSAGMRCVGEGIARFPQAMAAFTEPVPYLVYEIRREEWLSRHAARPVDPHGDGGAAGSGIHS